jgi:hypothetical protein
MDLALEYLEIVDDYKKLDPPLTDAEAESEGAQLMMRKRSLSAEEWEDLFKDIVYEGWLELARERLEKAKEKTE